MKKKLFLALCALLVTASLFAQNVQKTGFPATLLGNWKFIRSQEEVSDEEWSEIDGRISEFSVTADTYFPKAAVPQWNKTNWKIIDVKADVPGKQYTAVMLTEKGEGEDRSPGDYYGKITIYLNEFPQACIDEYGNGLDYYRNEIGGKPYFVMLFWSVINDGVNGHAKPAGASPDADLLTVLSGHHGANFWYAHFYDLGATPLGNEAGKVDANLFQAQPKAMHVFVKGNK